MKSAVGRLVEIAIVGASAAALACVDFSSLQVPGAADASNPADAGGADALADGADAAAPFCPTHPGHFLCADWDNVGTPDVGWTTTTVSGGEGGGAIAVDKSLSRSPPASFRSSVANGSTVGGTYAVLVETIDPHPRSITIALDILASATAGDAFDGVASYVGFQDIVPTPDGGAAFYGTGINLIPSHHGLDVRTAYVTPDGGYREDHADTAPLGSDWTHVELTVDFGPPQRVRVAYDGVPQVDHAIVGSTVPASSVLNVTLGIVSVSGGALHANYDNVTIDVVQ